MPTFPPPLATQGANLTEHLHASQPRSWWRLDPSVSGTVPELIARRAGAWQQDQPGDIEAAHSLVPEPQPTPQGSLRFNRRGRSAVRVAGTHAARDRFSVMVIFKADSLAVASGRSTEDPEGTLGVWPQQEPALLAGEIGAWELRLAATGELQVRLNGNRITWPGDAPIWIQRNSRHVAMLTFSAGTVKLYLDGALRGELPWAGPLATSTALRIGGVWEEDVAHSLFQGLVSDVVLWDYELPVATGWSTGVRNIWTRARAVVTVEEREVAQPLLRHLPYPVERAQVEEIARPIAQLPAVPLAVRGTNLTATERLRLLQDSLEGAELALMVTGGFESAPGEEVTGGGYERIPLALDLDGDHLVNVEGLLFEKLTAVEIQGWEVWSGSQRRWYGYWRVEDVAYAGGRFTALGGAGVVDDEPIVLPQAAAGIGNNTTYYVRDAQGSTFNVSATPGGAALTVTGTGYASFGRVFIVPAGESLEIEAGQLRLGLK